MIHKLAVLSALVISAFCAIHPGLYPLALAPLYPYPDNANYNFAYEVSNPSTGDVKNQQESRRGDTVIGQYSLLQPDGIQRTVDYKADDLRGFRAIVNNFGAPITKQRDEDKQRDENMQRDGNKQRDEDIQRDEKSEEPARDTSARKSATIVQTTPQWPIKDVFNTSPSSVAISRTSLFQIIRENPQHSSNSWK